MKDRTSVIVSAIAKCPKDQSGAVSYETLTAMVGCMEEVENWRKEKGYDRPHTAYKVRKTGSHAQAFR